MQKPRGFKLYPDAPRSTTFCTSRPSPHCLLALRTRFCQPGRFLDYTKKAVSFGPRSGGSAALVKTRAWIKQELSTRGCQLIPDSFIAQSPDASVPMENIICKFPGKSGKAIAITGHFDTKKMANFVGANDGGSSTGFLLELAAVLQGQPRVSTTSISSSSTAKKPSTTGAIPTACMAAAIWRKNGPPTAPMPG